MEDLPLRIPTRRVRARPPEPPDSKQKQRVALAAGLSLLWTIFTLLAQFSGILGGIEEPLIDWRQSLASYPAHPSDQLALIAIDRIPPNKPWPWSRLEYSLMLRSLIDYAPQSIVFEMNLNDRDTDYTSFDSTFSHVVERANAVVFAATVLSTPSPLPVPPRVKSLSFHGDTRSVPHFGSAIWPLSTFAGDSPVGANNVEAEPDLHLRRLPLVFMLDDKLIHSLVLQAAAQYLGADLSASDVTLGRAIFLRRHDGKLLRTLPIDDQGRLRIRFRFGAPVSWQAGFDNVLVYDDQIQNGISPGRDLHKIENRQVWIGRTDPAERERFTTAIGQLSRVEIELQAMRTILEQDYVRPLPPMILAALYLLVGIGGAAAIIRIGPVHAAALLIILAAFWLESAILVFRLYNVILPLPSFLMLLFGTYIMGLLAAFWDLEPETDKRQLPLEL
ncbi:MAG: CHASE2 domain-containing protein [Methylacidiphilales bacterium]|nr:CHASE2 domain-containing protein [Candidatus Methylacidiphilales bacterium]